MLTFNKDAYHRAISSIGFQNENYCYKEFICSEINYISHFLDYLNNEDIDILENAYKNKKNKINQEELSKDSLRYLYNALQNIKKAQLHLLEVLYMPEPAIWLKAVNNLYEYYVHFISTRKNLRIPSFVEESFKQIQAKKIEQGLPQLGTLDAIFIAPVQRFPRYALLSKELLKVTQSKRQESSCEALEVFYEHLLKFHTTVLELNQKLNSHITSPLTAQDLLELLQSHDIVAQDREYEPASPYLLPKGKRSLMSSSPEPSEAQDLKLQSKKNK